MKNFKTPKFITFEGGEGCGKSTQGKMLYEYLLAQGVAALYTREVGGTPEAEQIRSILLHSHLLPTSELLLVMAARNEHIHKVIRPALAAGKWVICDRYIDSTATYQGMAMEIGMDKVYQLHNELGLDLMPDITFFIDLPPEAALERAGKRGDNNKFEDKEKSFHQHVYEGFVALAAHFKDRIIKIEAFNLTKEELHQKILEFI